jgi:MbtH protein
MEQKMATEKRLDDYTIDGDVHKVLINEEGQYSIWPAGQKSPDGWTEVGPTGTKAECTAYVDANWLDMRPISLQKAMAKNAH